MKAYQLAGPLHKIPLQQSDVEFLELSEARVYNALRQLNPAKACGPDNIPNWILKEYAELLLMPITNILNSSFREQRLPSVWKLADLSPLVKQKPAVDLNKYLRPISLTPCMSKVAEDFVVCQYVKPAVLSVLDGSQYGAVPKSSTTLALLEMIHHWSKDTD